MKKFLIAPALVLFLSACAGDSATKANVALGIACDAAASLAVQIETLVENDVVPVDAFGKIRAADAAVDTACLPDSIVDPELGVTIVNNAISVFEGIKEAY